MSVLKNHNTAVEDGAFTSASNHPWPVLLTLLSRMVMIWALHGELKRNIAQPGFRMIVWGKKRLARPLFQHR